MQALLRQSFPQSTVQPTLVRSSAGALMTHTVNVHRDGLAAVPGSAVPGLALTHVGSAYERFGPLAYQTAIQVSGDAAAAEAIVEQVFTASRSTMWAAMAVEHVGPAILGEVRRLSHAARRSAASSRPTVPLSADGPGMEAMTWLRPAQRVALELAYIEGLPVRAVAERMQRPVSGVNQLLADALHSVKEPVARPIKRILSDWRAERRAWDALPDGHPGRLERSLAVAEAWLEYQAGADAILPEEAVLIVDRDRRYIAVTPNAARMFGRRSVVGLYVDDLTAENVRAGTPDVWATFVADGSLAGEYYGDRPAQPPIRLHYRAFADRPLPGLFVSHVTAMEPAKAGAPMAARPAMSSAPPTREPTVISRPLSAVGAP
ncbi:hypothetical protein BH20CHL7_BH20CHL7_06460 [soil metagenome]